MIDPAVNGVTKVETVPVASVCTIQVEAPLQAAKVAEPLLTERVTALFAAKETPSPKKSCTVKGTAAGDKA